MTTVDYIPPTAGSLWRRRGIAALIGGAALALLITAATLHPDSGGHGTHTQLGLPPCNFLQVTGYPCPSCGCTTAFAQAADGHFFAALHTQPFGALAAMALAMTVVITVFVAVTGVDPKPWLGGLISVRLVWGIVAVIVVSWMYKIAQAAGVFS